MLKDLVEARTRGVLTAGEVGARLRLPLSTVYYLAKAGRLRGFRVGRSWRFPAGEIDRLGETAMPLVLVADAHAPSRSFAARVLQAHGCRVEEAEGGAEAIARVHGNHFDVLLVDLTVGGSDGAGFIGALRREVAADRIVVVTPVARLADVPGFRDLGAVTLLPKPLAEEALVACVERMAGVPLRPTTEEHDACD